MAEIKTKPTDQRPEDFIRSLPDKRQADAFRLLEIMGEVSGQEPRMWGSSIIGFGSFKYTYASGHSGEWPRVGFSPRKTAISLYMSFDAAREFSEELKALGRHSLGKGCIYLKRLSDVDQDVLRSMIRKACQSAEAYEAGKYQS